MVSRVLKYNEAKQRIVQFIRAEALAVGERLPTERELAMKLGMSICPIRKAMEDLQACGMVRRVAGAGTFFEGHMECVSHESVCGLVNIGDNLFPNGYELYRLREYLLTQNAKYLMCSVSHTPNPSVLDELATCDRIMVTGFLNQGWIELLSSLGKPLVQVGINDFQSDLCKVCMDLEAALRLILKTFGATCHLGALFPSMSDACYSEQFHDMMKQALGTSYDSRVICPLSWHADRIKGIAHYLETYYGSLDALLVDEGHFLPLMMVLSYFPRSIDIPMVILGGAENLLPEGAEALPNLYYIHFPEPIVQTAAKILYEFPYSFLERGETYLVKPVLQGPKAGLKPQN